MNYAEAQHRLLLHGPGTTDATGQPLVLEHGFLGCLRPYTGLREENFHQLMEALLTAGDQLHQSTQVDRELAYAVWAICHSARGWGLAPGGMLQRNQLITAADTARLERWVDTVEIVALRLLCGWPPHHAVYYYAEYVVEVGWWDNAAFFIDLMSGAVSDPAISDSIGTIARALGKMGPLAKAALPALSEAERREYNWYTPADRCTEEVRAQLRQAIREIEE